MTDQGLLLWIDGSAGVAGDMLLSALVDAGAPLDACQSAVDAVIPATVRLHRSDVLRAGFRAAAVRPELLRPELLRPGLLGPGLLGPDQPTRSWTQIRHLIHAASLPETTWDRSLAVFAALARAEARVHGVDPEDVHFHEVGAWDSIADVVGVCAALDALGVARVVAGELAVGHGRVPTRHGDVVAPVPAVAELSRGWQVRAGAEGELATPTGMALVTTLAAGQGPLPSMTVLATGTGAGDRDPAGHPNVVRVVLGSPAQGSPGTSGLVSPESLLLLETTIDDLDPRVWPTVVDDLLAAGAADAWLTPVLMKKGRPGHVLTVLAAPELAAVLRTTILDRTSALGVRQWPVDREVLDRAWVDVLVDVTIDAEFGADVDTETGADAGTGTVPVKIGHRAGVIVHASPEFDDVARLARTTGRPVREILDAAAAAAVQAGLTPGSALPRTARSRLARSPSG